MKTEVLVRLSVGVNTYHHTVTHNAKQKMRAVSVVTFSTEAYLDGKLIHTMMGNMFFYLFK